MIGMAMGVDNGVQAGDGGAKSLGSKIGGGVDDHAEVLVLHPDRGSETSVPGVRGGADAAVAGEHGNTLGSAGAKKRQTHRE